MHLAARTAGRGTERGDNVELGGDQQQIFARFVFAGHYGVPNHLGGGVGNVLLQHETDNLGALGGFDARYLEVLEEYQ